jgi:hypothetical protein
MKIGSRKWVALSWRILKGMLRKQGLSHHHPMPEKPMQRHVSLFCDWSKTEDVCTLFQHLSSTWLWCIGWEIGIDKTSHSALFEVRDTRLASKMLTTRDENHIRQKRTLQTIETASLVFKEKRIPDNSRVTLAPSQLIHKVYFSAIV